MKLSKKNIIYVILLSCLISCGKKSSLDTFQDSKYPREYPKNYEN